MKLCVLIVTYQRPTLLHSCLCSIGQQTRPPDAVVVVGVDGDEATAAVVEHHAQEHSFAYLWRAASVPNVVEQTNIGLALVDADIVCFTNDDSEPYPDWLARLEKHYEDPSIGGVGGPDHIHLSDGKVLTGHAQRVGQISWFGRLYGNHHLSAPQELEVDFLKGVNMSCRRGLLPALDERLACSGVWHWELDASLRVKRAGKRLLYDPKVQVNHFPAPRPGSLHPDYVYEVNHNLTLALAKYFAPWRRFVFLLYTFLWGDYPEMGLVVFAKTYLVRLVRCKDLGFVRFLPISLRGKFDALRALNGPSFGTDGH